MPHYLDAKCKKAGPKRTALTFFVLDLLSTKNVAVGSDFLEKQAWRLWGQATIYCVQTKIYLKPGIAATCRLAAIC